jgi:hypothetical protein
MSRHAPAGRQARRSPRTCRRGGSGWRYRSVGRRTGAWSSRLDLRASLAARRAAASPDQTEMSSSSQTACMERSPTRTRRAERRGRDTGSPLPDRPEPGPRPLPERSCRSTPHRGSSIAGSRPQGRRRVVRQGFRAPTGWSKSAQARARPRPPRGFPRFADRAIQASRDRIARVPRGGADAGPGWCPAPVPAHPSRCDRDANTRAPVPGRDPDHHS